MEEKQKRLPKKTLALFILLAVVLVVAVATALVVSARNRIKYVKSDGKYSYINDDPRRATPDDGFAIDGVFDEKEYKDCKWLYLHNDNGDASVDLAMTSYYGEKGVYFAFDDTESTSVWVNPDRETNRNSAIELYLAPAGVEHIIGEEDVFEIDLLPNGTVKFQRRVGNDNWVNVRSSNDIMAYLGTTLKGGELDTGECHGYTLEFFIPWDYLDYLGLDVKAIKESHLMVNPVHITSYNYTGVDSSSDRYWYPFTRQIGGDGWNTVSRYFRFSKEGVLDTVPVNLVEGEHYTISGSTTVYPHLNAYVTIKPEKDYAIQSVLSNGEEKIRKVSYNEDGSVLVVLKGPEDAKGLTVSAVAEAITDGTKTLNGTVNIKKPGGDTFEGLTISCKGPDGNVKIKIDENGNFQLKDLKQGFYTIKASKDGYKKVTKGIYLKRNVDVDIDLNYEMFEVQNGYSWDLDEQADSKLFQWGGEGRIITVNSYDNFHMEANIRYDAKQKEISDDDYHTQQRTGIRIKYSNGKYLNANILFQNGKAELQYGKIEGDNSLFPWQTVYYLTEKELAQYMSADGIRFGVTRIGQFVLLYLNDRLVRVDDLGAEFANLEAQVGFEAFTSASYTMNYNFEYQGIQVPDDLLYGTNLDEGRILLIAGGTHEFPLPGSYVNMDMSLKAMDHPDGDITPRTDVLLEFSNGEKISFGVAENYLGRTVVQSTNAGLNEWKDYGELTADELAQYRSTAGVQLRIVRYGTTFYLMIGDRLVNMVYLENHIAADTSMKVTIRHYDDAGARIDIPFSITGNVSAETIAAIEANIPIFTGNSAWDFSKEKAGLITLKNGGGEQAQFLKRYTDVDVSVAVQDHPNATGEPRTAIIMEFENGESVSFSVVNQGQPIIQCSNGTIYKWQIWDNLTNSEVQKYMTKEGINFRVVRKGTTFYQFIGERLVKKVDLSDYIKADTAATIYIRHDGDEGADINIPFKISANVSNEMIAEIERMLAEIEKNKSTIFVDNAKWDLSKEKEGIVSLPGGGAAELDFLKKYADLDITVKVQDHPDGTEEPRTAVWLSYDNEKVIKFSVHTENGRVKLQTANGDLLTWQDWGDLTTDEIAQYKTGAGIDYRLVRKGNMFYQLIGDRLVSTINLAEKIDAGLATEMENMEAKITIRHDGDKDADIVIPFEISGEVSQDTIFEITGNPGGGESTDTSTIFVDNEKWDLSKEKEGIVSLPGGGAAELDFLKKYADLDITVKVQDHPDGTGEPRTAIWLSYDNGKVIKFSVHTENGRVKLQTANGDLLVWQDWGDLTPDEIAQYKTEAGIDYRLVREGNMFYQYIGDRLVSTINLAEKIDANLAAEMEKMEAKITIRHDGDNDADIVIPFEIADKSKIFVDNEKWDLSKEKEGIVSLPGGGAAELDFLKKYADLDITVRVQDHPDGTGDPRTAIWLSYDNGKVIKFSVHTENGRVKLQTANGDLLVWQDWGDLTPEEIEQYQTGAGIDYRLVRKGNMFYQLIGDRLVSTINLAEKIDANLAAEMENMEAKITIRHDGDSGADISIPFEISNKVTDETIALINNKSKIFVDNEKWDLSKEKEGIVSLPGGGAAELDFLKKYADLDITVRVQDHPDGTGDPRTAIWLSYDNGKVIKFSVHTENGRVKLQTANGNLLEWQEWGPLTPEEIVQYQTEEGIDYRLVRKGNMFYQYIGDRLVSKINLAEEIDANLAAEMENMEAKITIRHDGDKDANIEIPFAITGDVTAETISGITGAIFTLFHTVNALVKKICG